MIEPARKNEIIDPLWRAPAIGSQSAATDALPAIGLGKIERLHDVRIPAPADHQEPCVLREQGLKRQPEIGEQQNVAIDVAKQVVPGNLLCAVENRAQILRAVRVAPHLGNVGHAKG
ncbi:MAG: hypothetical protein LAN61_00785 [Acidobacteriia bacterium]|nr:hypothetical protein [Terriglobia bacterium]